ncbi:EthD domain-containing protein [Polaromonas glacialis]|uniref:EthD domain-containing protein n=1 Tax=Polaromonas glacialis TaxID=866564 RepID=UPI000A6A5DA5|nr:EthD domain-containing protein [Polaromonas glacialis]
MNNPADMNPALEAQARWKMIYLARRNPALAAGDFAQAWREHSALGRRCRNVQDKVLGVMQCTRLRESGEDGGLRGASTDYDGVNLLQLRDLGVASDLWNDPETLAIMRPDEPRVFSTYVRDFTLVCRERVLRDAPRGAVAVFAFVRRNASVATADFDTAWDDGPAPDWLAAPALQDALRVVHNTVVQTPPEGYDYDGIAEWWFTSAGAARAAFAGRDIRAQLPPAYAAVADVAGAVFMFTHVTHSRP